MNFEDRKNIVEKLEVHYSRNWLFEPMKRKNQIKFKFKKNKSQVNGRIYLSEDVIKYSIYEREFKFSYINGNNPIEQEFLTAFAVFYPYNGDEYHHFDDWISGWLHDRRRNNKRARKLYGRPKDY